ncbi:transcriptional regulator [Psychrobacillus sp. FSL H8-0510]|uniref:transcriptional regulator n=1 Tax=Psychrobacillus sp. FSL H8-0510 TaxID=2921394 RepID=UPI0030F6B85D
MNKLSRLDIQKIEYYWINHNDNKRQLKYREWELLNPHNDMEMNTGGGRSGKISMPTENKAVLLASDKLYQNLQHIVNTIESMYAKLDSDMKTIVDMRYWDTDGCYEWEDIADKLYMSRHKVLRKRNILIDKTAERIGWV